MSSLLNTGMWRVNRHTYLIVSFLCQPHPLTFSILALTVFPC